MRRGKGEEEESSKMRKTKASVIVNTKKKGKKWEPFVIRPFSPMIRWSYIAAIKVNSQTTNRCLIAFAETSAVDCGLGSAVLIRALKRQTTEKVWKNEDLFPRLPVAKARWEGEEMRREGKELGQGKTKREFFFNTRKFKKWFNECSSRIYVLQIELKSTFPFQIKK